MKSDVAYVIQADDPAAKTSEEILQELREIFTRRVRDLRRVVDLVKALEERGIDPSEHMPRPMRRVILDIACGKASAAFAEMCFGLPAYEVFVAGKHSLPLSMQEKLAAGEKLPLLVNTPRGVDTLPASPADLDYRQAQQIFDPKGFFRTAAGQRTILLQTPPPPPPASSTEPEWRMVRVTPKVYRALMAKAKAVGLKTVGEYLEHHAKQK